MDRIDAVAGVFIDRNNGNDFNWISFLRIFCLQMFHSNLLVNGVLFSKIFLFLIFRTNVADQVDLYGLK